jgi:hypothetical protein
MDLFPNCARIGRCSFAAQYDGSNKCSQLGLVATARHLRSYRILLTRVLVDNFRARIPGYREEGSMGFDCAAGDDVLGLHLFRVPLYRHMLLTNG